MFNPRSLFKCAAALGVIGVLLMISPGNSMACRMYGAIGGNLPDGMLYVHLVTDPNSIYNLSPANTDGWAIGHYLDFGDTPLFARGEPQANTDPSFITAVEAVNTSEPQITMAHIRQGTTGCDNVPDPHPFYRDKAGKWWVFMHNGTVDKTRMTGLIGPAYLTANPPNGSGIAECAAGVVDSELYFLYLLKRIEENSWNVTNGIVAAVNEIVADGETGGLNFVLSDGFRIWAFRRGQLSSHTLYYIYDSAGAYAAVASQYPSATQGNWVEMNNYELVMVSGTDAPVVFNVTDYAGELLVDSDFNGSLDDTDLRANSTGQDWYESREVTPTLLTLDTSNVGGNPTKKAKLAAANPSTGENAYLTQEFVTPQTGTFWAQADIYVDSITNLSGDPDRTAFLLIGDNSDPTRTGPNSDDSERFVYLAFYKDNGGTTGTMDLVARDRNDTWENFTTVASGLNLKQWYTIRVVCDIPGGTYDVYVDGVLRGTLSSRQAKTSVTHISFGEWDDGAGTYYVDNVRAVAGTPSPGPFLVDSDFNASADSADLRANSGGQNWYESRSDVPTLLTLDSTDVGGNSTKKAKFTASSAGNAYLTQDFGSPATGVFSVQWDIYVDSILDISGNPDRAGWMLIGDNTNSNRPGPNSDDSERFVYLGFFKDGGGTTGSMDLVARDRDDTFASFTTVMAGLQLKQWYTIKVVCDVPNGRYDVYVNGAFQRTVTSRNAKTQVTHISFAQWNDGAGSFYVDNVKVPIVCSGDIDGDGDRDGSDLALLITAYGTSQGQPNYDPFADLDGDGDVDQDDLASFAAAFGQPCQ
jgi:predicted glutamine amidotransferase